MRSALPCGRRPRSSARRGRAARYRRAGREPARAAGAGRPRTSGRARRPSSPARPEAPRSRPPRSRPRRPSGSRRRLRPGPRGRARAQRAGEEHRIRLADDDAAAHASIGRSASCTSPSTTPSSSPKRPSRSAIAPAPRAARRRGRSSSPGSTTSPERIRERHARGRLGDGALGLGDAALDPEHVQHPAAPTSERVTLSTASAAVRSGMTRNAAYP